MAGLVDEIGLVDEMKPGAFKPVSHKIPWSHIHDKPRVSREDVLMRMPAKSRATRVLLFSVLCLFVVVGFAPSQARQQVADKSAQSASASVASAPSSDVSKYVGAETCKTCHEQRAEQFLSPLVWGRAASPVQAARSAASPQGSCAKTSGIGQC